MILMKFNHETYRHNCQNNISIRYMPSELENQLKSAGWFPTLYGDGSIQFYSDWRAIGTRCRTKFISVKFDQDGNGPFVRMSASMTEETRSMFNMRYAELVTLLCKFGILG